MLAASPMSLRPAVAASTRAQRLCDERVVLAAAAARAAETQSRSDGTLTSSSAPSEPVTLQLDKIPQNTFLGAFLRQQSNLAVLRRSPRVISGILRLLARFWNGSPPVAPKPKAFDEFKIIFETFCGRVLAPAALGRCSRDDAALAMAMAFAPMSRSCCEEIDRLQFIQWNSRVTLVLRGGYLDIRPARRICGCAPRQRMVDTTATTPGVVNELRVRCVAVSSRPRLGRAVHLEARVGRSVVHRAARAPGVHALWPPLVRRRPNDWQPICDGQPYTGDKMEVRTFVSANVPLRRRCPDALAEAFLALDDAMLWAELDFHGDDDLTLDLARRVVARKSKLKNFLKPSETPGADPLLKTWPGKDAMQTMAVWYMAATLIEGHEYTEPELSCVMSSLCAFPPDHGVLRKEMVRRGFLGPPNIVTNADKTTATYFSVSGEGLRAVLRGEWRRKGVFEDR